MTLINYTHACQLRQTFSSSFCAAQHGRTGTAQANNGEQEWFPRYNLLGGPANQSSTWPDTPPYIRYAHSTTIVTVTNSKPCILFCLYKSCSSQYVVAASMSNQHSKQTIGSNQVLMWYFGGSQQKSLHMLKGLDQVYGHKSLTL